MESERYLRSNINPNDELDGGLITIDMYHSIVHEKRLFNLTHSNTALADNGYLTLGIIIPTDWEIHLFNISMFGIDVPFLAEVYPFCTFTPGSTNLTPVNHYQRVDLNAPSLVTFNTDPTGFVTGGKRSYSYFGGGSGVGGANSSGIFQTTGEWVLHEGKHLVRIQNLTGGPTLVQMALNWYEVNHYA